MLSNNIAYSDENGQMNRQVMDIDSDVIRTTVPIFAGQQM